MNIFVLDFDPKVAASFLIDRHASKMLLETAQLLCTTSNLIGIEAPYKTTHKNHPCSVWVRASQDNWLWAVEHGLGIAAEYTKRYGKVHKSEDIIQWCFDNPPYLPDIGLTPFALAMPDEYKVDCPVESYRGYYRDAKADIATWKFTEIPYWFY